jgi:glycosyltransferase involved in cell wall biosynthesis
LIVPSRFYGVAAAGKPIIMIGDRNGEISRIVQQHGCGIIVAPGDVDALVDALRLLSNAPDTVAEMGARARAMLSAHFTRQKALQRWSALLNQLGVFEPKPLMDEEMPILNRSKDLV